MPNTQTKGGRGLGYVPDAAHKRTQAHYHTHPTFRAAPPPPLAASLEQYEAPCEDQSSTGSCTGHGSSQGVYVTCAANKFPLGFFPSPRGIYTDTRCIERSDALPSADPNAPPGSVLLPPLQDNGAMPADIFRAICPAPGTAGGVRPMNPAPPTPDGRFSDVTSDNINSEETLADIELESPVCGDYRIPCAGDGPQYTQAGMVLQIKTAIASGCAVGIGVFVDTTFENWTAGQAPLTASQLNTNDPNGGGHWLALTSYRTDASGRVIFRGPNSWGSDWGDKGHYEVDETWLYKSASDIYVFTPKNTLAPAAKTEPETKPEVA